MCMRGYTRLCFESFRINKTLKLFLFPVFQSPGFESFRINKTLKPIVLADNDPYGFESFRINKTLKLRC